ncbi:hypothetical protein P3875_06655 [Myroides sp. JBRI-B21084]|uniref:hypothetical protein n=1 Tax=Myroides sp. JBRI-B21084 TaxID=3119977 RepID=UPI0026E20497|nr:hypothetical protein [Paenimyroides cloacae]WKW45466.1 hypothetical protein P3875_06655 [Paenimyroides cloacae]
MNYISKIIGIMLFAGFLNFTIFVQYIKSTNLPGGVIGMAPIGVLVASLITFILSLIIILVINKKRKITLTKAISIFFIIYFIIDIFFGLEIKELLDFKYTNVDLFLILIALSVWTIVTMFIRISSKIVAKKYQNFKRN